MQELLEHINAAYFWDVDPEQLDALKSKRLIIDRVYSLGTLKEIELIDEFYGRKEIIKTLTGLAYIDRKTMNFISVRYGIPKSSFRCYRRMRSIPKFWD